MNIIKAKGILTVLKKQKYKELLKQWINRPIDEYNFLYNKLQHIHNPIYKNLSKFSIKPLGRENFVLSKEDSCDYIRKLEDKTYNNYTIVCQTEELKM